MSLSIIKGQRHDLREKFKIRARNGRTYLKAAHKLHRGNLGMGQKPGSCRTDWEATFKLTGVETNGSK